MWSVPPRSSLLSGEVVWLVPPQWCMCQGPGTDLIYGYYAQLFSPSVPLCFSFTLDLTFARLWATETEVLIKMRISECLKSLLSERREKCFHKGLLVAFWNHIVGTPQHCPALHGSNLFSAQYHDSPSLQYNYWLVLRHGQDAVAAVVLLTAASVFSSSDEFSWALFFPVWSCF